MPDDVGQRLLRGAVDGAPDGLGEPRDVAVDRQLGRQPAGQPVDEAPQRVRQAGGRARVAEQPEDLVEAGWANLRPAIAANQTTAATRTTGGPWNTEAVTSESPIGMVADV
ncbi:hypothetical protein ABZ801_21480 [Actinomadura sp. NPDC047616]|uniref:hypothetical protein n=1 Tax=Actinomadura sp. NPDC047616 TaxID=3155914 RepID=UPI0033CF1991